MYRVISDFADLQDGEHIYHVGDTFPRMGLMVSDERIAELSGFGNRQGNPLIEAVTEPVAEPPVSPNKPIETATHINTPDEQKPAEKPHRGRKKANVD